MNNTIANWNEFKAEHFHCYADAEGKYPCDYGVDCDKCSQADTFFAFGRYLNRKEQESEKVFTVTVTDTATYTIRAKTKEQAINEAWDWFNERIPKFEVVEGL